MTYHMLNIALILQFSKPMQAGKWLMEVYV
jgi:hypothetical protein